VLKVIGEKAANNYSAFLPDLPGCVATGETIEDAQREIAEAIHLHLEGLHEDGQAVPLPSSIGDFGGA
jgi:predicted RNase H-like HicB family nuclease